METTLKELAPFSESKDEHFDRLQICLQNIKSFAKINAFVHVYEEEACDRYSKLNHNGSTKSLNGMIVGLKDLFCYKDHPVSAGSRILQGFISNLNATCVQRLIDAEAVIIGHQNCDEFGMGSSNERSIYGPVLNPLDVTKVSGGSSGGSAAAVRLCMCDVALGTDTGGSVRLPAAFCGIVGLKPTYSRISRYGVIAYASSFDTVGILAKNIDDCALVLNNIAGPDDNDNTCYRKKMPHCRITNVQKFKKARIAYFKEIIDHEALQSDIKKAVTTKLEELKLEGHEVAELNFSMLDFILPVYYILSTAEASANLARYDGVRYGHRSVHSGDIEALFINSRTEGFGIEVKRRILLGIAVLSKGYYSEYYTRAQKIRRMIKQYLDSVLKEYDFIIMPTTPTTAFKLNMHADPISLYLADLFTVPASLAGVPAISIPNGADRDGMPIGLQIIAADFQEDKLLSFAKYLMNKNN